MSVWEDHRTAYEAHLAADEASYKANVAHDEARKAVIMYLSKKVAEDEGFSELSGAAIDDFVTAAESRHADTLGHYKPRKPLQIELLNPRLADESWPLDEPPGLSEGPTDTATTP